MIKENIEIVAILVTTIAILPPAAILLWALAADELKNFKKK
jgi:hypothetical protein